MVTRQQAEYFVSRFAAGWAAPHTPGMTCSRPMGSSNNPFLCPGKATAAAARVRPPLQPPTGHDWPGGLADDAVLIELACSASVAGHPLSCVVVDRCVLNDDSLCTHRTTYMNPIPLAWALATRPRAWPRWWRSGVGPVLIRRRVVGVDERVDRPTTGRH